MNTADWRALFPPLWLVLGAWLAAHGCFWLLPNVFEPWNAQAVDQLFVLRNALPHLQPAYDTRIVHVDLKDTSMQRLQTFYLDRLQHARVIRNLAAMGVAAQAHDFIFAARMQAEVDRTLIEATAAAGQAYFGTSLALGKATPQVYPRPERTAELRYLESTAWQITVRGEAHDILEGFYRQATFAPLARAARGLGNLSVLTDRDGVYRRLPLLVRYGTAFYPSFALRVICDYLRVPPAHIVLQPGKHLTLRQAQGPADAQPHDVVIPIDRRGNMLLNFVGAWERMQHYDIADILLTSGDRDLRELLREDLAGKLVVVADTSTGSSDVGPIPLDPAYPLSGLHSNTMNTILTGQFLRELSMLEMLGIEVLLLGLIVGQAWRLPSRWLPVGTLLTGVGYVVFAAGCFLYGQRLCNLLRPSLFVTFATGALVMQRYVREERAKLESLRQRDFIGAVFGRYLSNTVVEEILGSPRGLEMGGESRQITLLVSDLRGFTSLSARLLPREVITILNRYFERMIDVVMQYRGTVDELMGDGMLVFFGAPLTAPDDPERAVACAIAMQTALSQLNAELRAQHLPELAMGIGINSGEVIVGNIGSLQRSKYGAVGSAINTTYRIESYTVGGQILVSPSTYERVQSLVQVRGTLQAQFKGLAEPVTLYDIGAMHGPYALTLPDKLTETFFTLPAPLPLACYPVDGKVVASTAIAGQLTRLAGSTIESTLAEPLPVYTNVKLILSPPEHPPLPEMYAKVLRLQPAEAGAACVHLELTSVPEAAKAFLAGLTPPVAGT